jgi:hypothetical protein
MEAPHLWGKLTDGFHLQEGLLVVEEHTHHYLPSLLIILFYHEKLIRLV